MVRAAIVVPPFIKYSSGPLLGPSLLQSAARLRGHECSVLDLNAHYIYPRASPRMNHGNFIGDHDKPTGPNSLGCIEEEFVENYVLSSLYSSGKFCGVEQDVLRRRVQFGFLSHGEVRLAASIMATSSFGKWVRDTMRKHIDDPRVVGVSLLHAGQVVPAVAVSMVARTIWPNALLLFGGPHISGLGRKTLEQDLVERSFAADVFVTGHAEQTFAGLLDWYDGPTTRSARLSKIPSVLSGASGPTIAPTFESLELYDAPLTLPAQSSLGCSYGRCAYCTYPAIEPTPARQDLRTSVKAVADVAAEMRASVSLKDSLATPKRLAEIGGCIADRAPWSACTKLSKRLELELLRRLRGDGLATLEVGLESLLEDTQRRIGKVQPQSLFENFVADFARVPSLSLVVNYMVNFPFENATEAHAKLAEARAILESILGPERACLELNEFELERLAPMARFPELYGIDKRAIKAWPWASVLEITTNA